MRLDHNFKKTAVGAIVLAVVLIIGLGVAKYMHRNTIEANYGKAISTALNTTPPVTCPPGYPLYETAYVTPYVTRAKKAFADLVLAQRLYRIMVAPPCLRRVPPCLTILTSLAHC